MTIATSPRRSPFVRILQSNGCRSFASDTFNASRMSNEPNRRAGVLEREHHKWCWNSESVVDFPFLQQVIVALRKRKEKGLNKILALWKDEIFALGGEDLGERSVLDKLDCKSFVDFWMHLLQFTTAAEFDALILASQAIVTDLVTAITSTRRQRVLWQLFCQWDFNGNGTVEFNEIEPVLQDRPFPDAPPLNLTVQAPALNLERFQKFVLTDLLKGTSDDATFFRVVGGFLDRIEVIRANLEPEKMRRREAALNGFPEPLDDSETFPGRPGGNKAIPSTTDKTLLTPRSVRAHDDDEYPSFRQSEEEKERRRRVVQQGGGDLPVALAGSLHTGFRSPRTAHSPTRPSSPVGKGLRAPVSPRQGEGVQVQISSPVRGSYVSSKSPRKARWGNQASSTTPPPPEVVHFSPTPNTAEPSPMDVYTQPSQPATSSPRPAHFEPPPAAMAPRTPRTPRTDVPRTPGPRPAPRTYPDSAILSPHMNSPSLPSSASPYTCISQAAGEQDWENHREVREKTMPGGGYRSPNAWWDTDQGGWRDQQGTDVANQRQRDKTSAQRRERERRSIQSEMKREMVGTPLRSGLDTLTGTGQAWGWEQEDRDRQELHKVADWGRNKRRAQCQVTSALGSHARGWGWCQDSEAVPSPAQERPEGVPASPASNYAKAIRPVY